MVNVVIEPYEPLIAKAIELIQKKEPGYFQGISKIVVEPTDTGHFGRVESDKPDIIFISIGRLRNALAATNEESQILEAALTLAHEMGHLKSQFQGGEAPAESEEARMAKVLTSNLRLKYRAARYDLGLKSHPDILVIAQGEYISPYEIANAILTIINYFANKVKPEKKREYINRILGKLQVIDPIDLSRKPKNPNAGIGASMSLIKNLLSGLPYPITLQALNIVYQGLSKI